MSDHQPQKKLGKYYVCKTLGKGRLKVKLVYDPTTKMQFAAKVCKSKLKVSSLEQEANVLRELSDLNVPNVVKILDFVVNTHPSFRKIDFPHQNDSENISEYNCKAAIIMELAENDTMFEYIFDQGPFGERISRQFFKELAQAVKGLHNNGYCHLDLKPDNILFDKDFHLKLCDFGFAKKFVDPLKNKFNSRLGTEWYMAPEIYVNEEYVGTKVDIFACGIILFIMIFGKPPFFKADHRDPFYKFFVNKNPTGFWEIYEEKVTKGIKIDPDLKEILSSIFNFDPEERPDWETILGFAWMRKDVMDRDIMLNEMNAKRDLLVSKKKG